MGKDFVSRLKISAAAQLLVRFYLCLVRGLLTFRLKVVLGIPVLAARTVLHSATVSDVCPGCLIAVL